MDNGNKCSLFRNILSNQSIHIFIGASFPSKEWVSKEKFSLQFLSDAFMFSKFFAIVRSDRVQAFRVWLEQVNYRIAYQINPAVRPPAAYQSRPHRQGFLACAASLTSRDREPRRAWYYGCGRTANGSSDGWL